MAVQEDDKGAGRKLDKRYTRPIRQVTSLVEKLYLETPWWVNCPEHGVGRAVNVKRWEKEASVIMEEVAEKKWFKLGRYTSGDCGKCGMTLSLTRWKPRSVKGR